MAFYIQPRNRETITLVGWYNCLKYAMAEGREISAKHLFSEVLQRIRNCSSLRGLIGNYAALVFYSKQYQFLFQT